MFFADAAILVEGVAESMLLPHFIRSKFPELYQRYITILGVNGRHAHRLSPLIEKLCLPTLVITDLKIVKEYSPLMESKKWISLDDQTKALQQVESAVDKLMELWKDDAIPTCLDVLRSIQDTGLFKLDERVDNILSSPAADESIRITALRKALSVPFTTLEKYFAYVSDNTRFATHQGVKGLEFPRVMVIIDDAEAKGFLFSYEKLFGVKLKTETDIKNEREGKDNSITRTTRLFYVACTRAQKSLAIIAYTYDCEAVKATAMKNNWFEDDEIRLLE